MVVSKLSDCFKFLFLYLKTFGIWPGENPHRYYKFYATFFLCINFFLFNTLLIINFIFTPPVIEEMILEVVFLFTEFTVIGKVFMVLVKRKELIAAFDVLNCEDFKGNDEGCKKITERHVSKIKKGWKMYVIILAHISYFSKVFMPIIMHLIFKSTLELPICRYNFLDDGIVQRYFAFLFIYQSVGLYSTMHYNLNIDTLIAGLLFMAIAQVKALKHELKNLRGIKNKNSNSRRRDAHQVINLHAYLKHYEKLLNYCNLVQGIIGITMFIQFSMSSAIICIVLCRMLMPWTIDFFLFIITYLCGIILQILLPSWLGTELSYESAELVTAAYSSEWIPRSEQYKRSLKLFMTRANTTITMTAWRIFPLSLDTFISIMKLAYSFFTLIRNFQNPQ